MPISEDKIKQITLKSEYFQDILEKVPSKIITWGNTGMLMIFLIICIGLQLIKYPDDIISNATIVNERPPVEVYSRTSGRISHFLKHDQDKVNKGDWIIILNNSADYIDIKQAMGLVEKVNAKNIWNSLNNVQFPSSLILGDIQGSYYDFLRSVEDLKRYARLKTHEKITNINTNREIGIRSKRSALENQYLLDEKELDISKSAYDRMRNLFDAKVATKSELEEKEMAYLTAKEKVENVKTNLINARLESEIFYKEVTSANSENDDVLSKLKNDVLEKFNSLLFELSEWKTKYVLISPIDGRLDLFDIRTENQFLTNEKKVFTITPVDNRKYFAIIELPITNSGKVHVGQNCIIKLHNYPYMEFGMLTGKVQSISSTTKEGFYTVKVTLPDQLATTQHKILHPIGELTGTSEIIIEDLTLFKRLFYSAISKN